MQQRKPRDGAGREDAAGAVYPCVGFAPPGRGGVVPVADAGRRFRQAFGDCG